MSEAVHLKICTKCKKSFKNAGRAEICPDCAIRN